MKEHIPEEVLKAFTKREVEKAVRAAQRRRDREKGLKPLAGPRTTFFSNTVTHRILAKLEMRPHTSRELGAGVQFGQQNVSAQILRLLESGLITRDHSIYYITNRGRDALTGLSHGWSSHTEYLAGK